MKFTLIAGLVLIGVGLAMINTYPKFAKLFFVAGIWWLISALKHLWYERNASPVESFREKLSSIEDLPEAKEITVTVTLPLTTKSFVVYLNGEPIGRVSKKQPLTFLVHKKKNVLLVDYKNTVCYFEVCDVENTGIIEIGIGFAAPSVDISGDCGLVEIDYEQAMQ